MNNDRVWGWTCVIGDNTTKKKPNDRGKTYILKWQRLMPLSWTPFS
jgi:hypothetical protein